jgi:hypothetical protein
VPEGWVASTGCRGCLNDDTLADTVAVIVAALPGAAAGAEGTVRQALLAVVESGSRTWYAQRYRQIVAYLAEHPDGLTSGASTTPVDVALLITALRGLGRDDVVDPHCADCGRTCFPRHHRPDGLRICITCDGRRRYAACGQCGRTRPIFRRLLNGSPLCQPCHQADPGGWETCGRCGESAPIRVTVGGVRIGQCCYLKPHERCSVCGLGRAVSPYASGKATCADCASRPHGPCVHCGLDATASSRSTSCAHGRTGLLCRRNGAVSFRSTSIKASPP